MKKTKKDTTPKAPKLTARPVFEEETGPPVASTVREFTSKAGKKLSYNNMSFDEFEVNESKVKKTGKFQDKIFDNTYNTGSTDTQKLPDIKVDNRYAESRLDDCYDVEQYTVKRELLDKVYDLYMDSQWKSLPRDKKFPKELAPFIFNDLWTGLAGNNHSAMDMFIAIAEFMNTSYEKVYEAAGLKVKDMIIRELEEKYKMLSKKKINRLF